MSVAEEWEWCIQTDCREEVREDAKEVCRWVRSLVGEDWYPITRIHQWGVSLAWSGKTQFLELELRPGRANWFFRDSERDVTAGDDIASYSGFFEAIGRIVKERKTVDG